MYQARTRLQVTELAQEARTASAKRSYVKLDRLADALAWARLLVSIEAAPGATPRKRTRGRGGEAVLGTDTPALIGRPARNFQYLEPPVDIYVPASVAGVAVSDDNGLESRLEPDRK